VIGSCHGDANKTRILEAYDVVPVLQLTLLGGQAIHGCCGDITDRYYQFEATDKASKAVETFVVGHHCAEEFCKRLGVERPPLFNPLRATRRTAVAATPGSPAAGRAPAQDARHPLNQEVWEAVSLICTAWGGTPPKPSGILAKLIKEVRDYPRAALYPRKIQALNKAIINSRDPRTIGQMQTELRAANPNMRQYDFPLIAEVLRDAGEADIRF
jgi:hypothetical protein